MKVLLGMALESGFSTQRGSDDTSTTERYQMSSAGGVCVIE
jgi:hypothetical protein